MINRKKALKLLILSNNQEIERVFDKIDIKVNLSDDIETDKFIDFLDVSIQNKNAQIISIFESLKISVSKQYSKKINYLRFNKIVTGTGDNIIIDFNEFIKAFYLVIEIIDIVKHGIEGIRYLIENRNMLKK